MRYEVVLSTKQYSELERMLRNQQDLSRRLTENRPLNLQELIEYFQVELESLKQDGIGIQEFGMPIFQEIAKQIPIIHHTDGIHFELANNDEIHWVTFRIKVG